MTKFILSAFFTVLINANVQSQSLVKKAQMKTGNALCKNEMWNHKFESSSNPKVNLHISQIQKGTGMKRTGLILMGAGIISIVAGIAIMVSNDSYGYSYSYNDNYEEENGSLIGGLGLLMASTGTTSTGAGIPLFIIGNKLEKRSKDK